MVVVLTRAYNAEGTIRRAIESALNQTYQDIKYYVLDNGSTDQTGDIITEYAYKDSRIFPLHNAVNNVGWDTLKIIEAQNKHDFFCTLDADDAYLESFIEESLAFLNECDLDVVACGNSFISVETGLQMGERSVVSNIALRNEQDFDDFFYIYHQFMRTEWGKLYKISVLKARQLDKWFSSGRVFGYGADTVLCMEAFRCAERVGILAGTKHKYYVSAKSVSHQFDPRRIASDQILFDAARDFLTAKCGMISPQNLDCLFGVYMNALIDTSSVLLRAKIDMGQKLDHLQDMMDCAYTKQLAALENFGDRIDLGPELRGRRKAHFRAVADWLLSLEEVSDKQFESFCDMGEFSCAVADFGDGWVQFNKLRILFLLQQNRKQEAGERLKELLAMLPNDPDLLGFGGQL